MGICVPSALGGQTMGVRLQGASPEMKVLVPQSCLTLCDPMDGSGQPWSEDQGPQVTALASSPGLVCLLQTQQKHSGGSGTPCWRGEWILVQVRLTHLWKDPWLDPSPCWASGVSLESHNTSFKAVTYGLGFCDCKLLAPERHPVQCSSHMQLLN